MLIQKKATLLRWEGRRAILQLDSGEEIMLSKDDFPRATQIGAEFSIKIQPMHEASLGQEELACTLLNEILADDQTPPNHQTS